MTNASGSADITAVLRDGGTTDGGQNTLAEVTFTITMNAVNDAPAISVLAGSGSQSACLSGNKGRITLKLGDVDSNVSDLKLGVSSSNTRLVPNANVASGGSGETRTAAISTVPGRTGSATVTITAGDGQKSASVPVTVQAGGNDTLSGSGVADLSVWSERR